MKKLMKFLIYITLIVILALVGTIIYITNFINPNDYKPEIKSYAQSQLNIDLDIQGNVGWSFFPWVGFSVENVTIKLPNNSPFAKVAKAEAYLSLLALLKKEVNMKGITLNGLDLTLSKDKEGHGNWEAIGKKDQQENEVGNQTKSEKSESKPLAFAIANIRIEQAHIRYEEQASGQTYEFSDFNLSSRDFSLDGHTFPIKISSRIEQKQAELSITIDAATDMAFNLDQQTYALKNLNFDAKAQGDFSQNNPVALHLSGDIFFDKLQNHLALNNVSGSVANMNFSASLEATNKDEGDLTGQLNIPAFNARELLETLGKADALSDLPPDALTKVTLKTSLKNANDLLSMPDMSVQLDDTHIDGSMSMNLKTSAIKFNLSGDEIDLKQYSRTDQNKNNISESETDTKIQTDKSIFPVETLRTLQLDGVIALQKLITEKTDINDIKLAITANNGIVTIANFSGQSFDGSFKSHATLNVKTDTPQLTASTVVTHMQASTLFKALAKKELMTGLIDLTANIATAGNTAQALKQHLSGSAKVDVIDGVLKDLALEKQVCDGIAKIRQEGLEEKTWDKDTPFETLHADFTINNGIIHTSPLIAKTKSIDIEGEGDIDLPNNALDYRLDVTIIGDTQDHACSVNERYQDIPLPIRCKGKFSESASKWCLPDLANMQKVILKIGQKEIEQKLGEKIEEKLGDSLDEKTKEKIGETLKDIGKIFGK